MGKLGHMVFDLILNNDFVPKKTMNLYQTYVMKIKKFTVFYHTLDYFKTA